MNRTLLVPATFVLCACALAQDVQSRAEALLQHARQMEDIRSPNAPAFRLQATFSFMGDDLEPVQGTYIETWVSNERWRQETVVGDLHRIAVGGPGKHWIFYPEGFLMQADQLPVIMMFLPPATLHISFAAVNEHTQNDVTAECAITAPGQEKFRSAFCFDKKSGVLLQKVFPQRRPRNILNFSCGYGKFQKFGAYVFPREVACSEDQHKSVSAKITDLSVQTEPDAAIFSPPPNAIEIPDCSGKMVTPFLVSTGLIIPLPDRDQMVYLQAWFVVDTEGKPQDLILLRSTNKESYKDALKTLQAWTFAAGTCNGKPIPVPITMEIPVPAHQ